MKWRFKSLKIKSVNELLTSIWLLGLVIAVPVILTLPDIFNKYRIKLSLQEPAPQPNDYKVSFRDVDGNGIRQKIYSFQNIGGQLAVQYFGDQGGLINEIIFNHKYNLNVPNIFIGDANQNGKPEIYGFTMEKDSLFLNWTELVHLHVKSSESLFITRVGTYNNGKADFSVNRFTIFDLDNDGNREIVFPIIAGHSIFPRVLVVYHPETGRVVMSEDIHINPYSVIYYDINGDDKIEILVGSNAGYNISDDTGSGIIDNRSYLLAYNPELKMVFPPVPLSAGINNNISMFINNSNQEEIFVFQFNQSMPRDKMIRIYKLDFDGVLRDSVILSAFGKRFRFQVLAEANHYLLYTGDKMLTLDMDLNVVDQKDIMISTQVFYKSNQLKGDPEFLFTELGSQKVFVYGENFKHKVNIEYEEEKVRSVFLDIGQEPGYFMIQTTKNEYTYQYLRNFLWYLRYPISLVTYLLSVLFVWLVQNVRERQLHEKFELKNQLKELEIKYLRIQMDPHFMFNAFTTMALMIKNGERNEAFDSFMKFTRMLRSNFDFSNHLTRPLNEELQTVRDYLEINKLRFKERLNYEINVAGDVSGNALIPKMIIQVHVENSLKHGLSQQEKPGFIRIEVAKDAGYLHLIVEDNGIGRKKAAALNKTSTKQGIKMLEALMERLNTQNKQHISQSYTDLQDGNGNAAGTRVDILVPLNLKGIVEQ